jgi:signal transduction histidine kinase
MAFRQDSQTESKHSMKKANSALIYLIGNRDDMATEKYFVTVACFTSFVFLVLLASAHAAMELKPAPAIIAGGSSLIVLGIYLMARFGEGLFLPKLTLTIFGILMFDLAWYLKYMSNGPVLFMILVYGALIIWVWEGRHLLILLSVYFLNLFILLAVELTSPEYLLRYPEMYVRSLDIYISLILISAFVIFLLYFVKREYLRQKEKAMKSDELKSAFLANISHEIRTPMNAISGFSELLCDQSIEPVRSEYYKTIIRESCNNLSRLFNDILDLSKMEAGDIPLKLYDLSIGEMILELEEFYRLELEKRNKQDIELDFRVPSPDITVHSDALRLKQVLSNLLDNAVKFTSRGKISLDCAIEGREVVFKVSDTGTGIPEEDQVKIFDRFVKFDYNGSNAEGSGIGLSIVDKIVRLLNGRIRLTSIYGEGSSFFISIPYIRTVSGSGYITDSLSGSLP